MHERQSARKLGWTLGAPPPLIHLAIVGVSIMLLLLRAHASFATASFLQRREDDSYLYYMCGPMLCQSPSAVQILVQVSSSRQSLETHCLAAPPLMRGPIFAQALQEEIAATPRPPQEELNVFLLVAGARGCVSVPGSRGC